MRYRLVMFDFDGTLADSFPWFIRVVNTVADRYRFQRIRDDEVDLLRGYGARRLMRHLRVSPWKLPFIVRHMRLLKSRDVRQIPLFPGVDGLLRALDERGVELALVTSNSYENAVRILGPENAARIRYWECGASVFGKRARFRRVLRRSGVPRAEALCVGDEIRDLEAARAEGIPFGAVAWGYTRADALRAHDPDELFETVEEIVAWSGKAGKDSCRRDSWRRTMHCIAGPPVSRPPRSQTGTIGLPAGWTRTSLAFPMRSCPASTWTSPSSSTTTPPTAWSSPTRSRWSR